MKEELKHLQDNYNAFKEVFRTGVDPVSSKPVAMQDLFTVANAGVFIPRVVREVMKDAVEPAIILTNLMTRVPVQKGTVTMTMASGAFDAADIAEGEEYPEREFTVGGGTTTAQIGKSGLMVRFTEEIVSRSQFEIVNTWLRKAGQAMARHKEKKVANFMTNLGTTVFDNDAPTSSLLGVTTGRAIAGTANGSITWDDLFDMCARVIANGYTPNTMVMHPLMWAVWMKDPVLRTFALNAGGGTWWGNYQGNPAARAPWQETTMHTAAGRSIVPGGAASGTPTPIGDYPAFMQAAPSMPQYMSPFPLTIITSPFMYYDPVSKLSDIIIFDRNYTGYLLVEEELSQDEGSDWRRDIMEIKLRERYGLLIAEEGLPYAVAKNIKAIANEIVLPARTTYDTSSLPTITSTVPVV